MNRQQFLTTLLAGAAPAQADYPVLRRRRTDFTGRVAARPEEVFPLLCPVREYEWLAGWDCRMLYSESGVAEDNCLFATNFHGQPMIWTVVRYEPPRCIEFSMVAPGALAVRLRIQLEADGSGTRIRWVRTFTGLSAEGNEQTGDWKTERDADLTDGLAYFLRTGTQRLPLWRR